MSHRAIITYAVIALLAFIVIEVLIIFLNGKAVSAPNIPRTTEKIGAGPSLTYVVMGDSTSIGQGADYEHSYAYASARHLAKSHTVTFVNVGVSGARSKDVLDTQLSKATGYQPDVVLIGVSANDVTHGTSSAVVRQSLQSIIDGLKKANPAVKIVVTGCPAVGSVPRFASPVRQLAGLRVRQMNHIYDDIVAKNNLILAPVAAKTGKIFLKNPQLFAQDKFHPNAAGYKLWIPVVNDALDQALAYKRS